MESIAVNGVPQQGKEYRIMLTVQSEWQLGGKPIATQYSEQGKDESHESRTYVGTREWLRDWLQIRRLI